MSIKPISSRIGKLIDEFLDDADYYEEFKKIAIVKGITSTDPKVVKVSMFSVKKDELIFTSKKLEALFTEWQLFTQLVDREPYSTLLQEYPERKKQVMDVARKLLEGEDVTNDDVLALFKGLTDEG